ncbi:hypothetical protein AAG747_08900 [Rapidithrix thailandica]|uniref:DUF748 domain-containing protein n=1 Tax=Rapidithrix thailandica TaxID=413964 RepID=A0AAW9S4M2_9BACT
MSKTHETPTSHQADQAPLAPKKAGLKRFIRKSIFGFFGFFLLLINGQLLLQLYTEDIVGALIKEIVHAQSGGLYYADFDRIHFNLFKSGMKFTNLQVRLDSNKYNPRTQRWDTNRNVYEVQIPEAQLSGLQLAKIYWDNELHIQEIAFEKPHIQAFNYKTREALKEKDQHKLDNLYFIIADYLKLFRINNFQINNASLQVTDLSKENVKFNSLENISLQVNDFVIDSLASTLEEQIAFTTSGITLQITNNSVRLENTPYEFHLGELYVSTADSLSYVKNVHIRTFQNHYERLNAQRERKFDYFQLRLPELRFEGVDFHKAYFDKKIYVDQISVLQPSGKVIKHPVPDSLKQPLDLYALLGNYLELIDINQINLKQANFDLTLGGQALVLNDFTFQGGRFLLDSATQQFRKPKLYLDNFSLSLRDYRTTLPDQLHNIKAGHIRLSTYNRAFNGRNIFLTPVASDYLPERLKKKQKKQVLNCHFPQLQLTGFDVWKLLNEKKLDLHHIKLTRPKLEVLHYPYILTPDTTAGTDSLRLPPMPVADSLEQEMPAIESEPVNIKNLYPLLSKQFRSVSFNRMDIENGVFDVTRYAQDTTTTYWIDAFSVSIDSMRLDPYAVKDSSKILYTRDIALHLTDAGISLPDSLHMMEIDQLDFSIRDSSFYASGLLVYPTIIPGDPVLYQRPSPIHFMQFNLQQLLLEEIDFHKLYYDSTLRIGQFSLNTPDITYFKDSLNVPVHILKDSLKKQKGQKALALSQVFKGIEIENFDINNGKYQFYQYQVDNPNNSSADFFSVCMRAVQLDTNALQNNQVLLQYEDAEVITQNLSLQLPDSIHTLTVGEMILSKSNASLLADQIQIQPKGFRAVESLPKQYDVYLPTLQLYDVDWDKLYYDQELEMGELLIPRPQIIALLRNREEKQKKQRGSFSLADLPKALSKTLRKVAIRKIDIPQGNTSLIHFNQKGQRQALEVDNFHISLEHLSMDTSTTLTPDNLLFSQNLQVKLEGVHHLLPDQAHQIKVDHISFSTRQQDIVLEGFHMGPVKPFTANPQLLATDHKKQVMDVKIPRILIQDLDVYQGILHKALVIDTLHLEKPEMTVYTNALLPKPDKKPFNPDSLYAKVANGFHSYQINHIQFDQANLALQTRHPDKIESLTIPLLQGSVTRFQLDSTTYQDQSRFLFTDDITLQFKEYSLDLPDSLYAVYVKNGRISTGKQQVVLDSIQLIPLVDKYELGFKVGHEQDWMSIKNKQLQIDRLNFHDLLFRRRINVGKLAIDGMDMTIFRDKRPPFPENHSPKLPQQALREAPVYIKIDTINYTNNSITYEELAEDGKQPGAVKFKAMNVYAYNITNDSSLLAKGLSAEIYAYSYMMGTGLMTVTFTVPLADEKNTFYYEGKMDQMNLKEINPMLTNVAFLKIKSGTADKMAFKVEANDDYAKGKMNFHYKNLEVSLLNKNTQKSGLQERLLNFFINRFLVKGDNPKFLFTRKANIYKERDKSKSIFNYMSATVMRGIISSIGIKKGSKEKNETKEP